ncbi:MAG: Mur ligase family protein [Candidatus Micrarchaeota archaeon]
MRKLLSLLGDPQKDVRCVLVAGSNGKGSTTAMLADILARAGRPTGSYFSPSIFSFRERIQMDGQPVSEEEFASLAQTVLALLPRLEGDPATFFEVMTAMAFLHFSRRRAAYAVLEAGLGGRFDATNACEPVLSIITSIGLEHTDVLGSTRAQIAREKAGILRSGRPAVIAVSEPDAREPIHKIARSIHCDLHEVRPAMGRVRIEQGRASFSLRLPRGPAIPIDLATRGAFQAPNAACAAMAAGLLNVEPSVIPTALCSFMMPARWQTAGHWPLLIIDCAHNPPAAQAIRPDLERDFAKMKKSPRVLVFAAMADKDYASVLKALAPFFDFILVCRPPLERAAPPEELKKSARQAVEESGSDASIGAIAEPDAALARAKSLAGKDGRILVAGSIYLLQYLFGEREFRIAQ